MTKRWLVLVLISVWGLSACDEVVITEQRHYHTLHLEGFHLVDSYYVNSEFERNRTLRLDPYIDDGLFEVYWYVNSSHNYRATLSINDRPSLNGALIVGSELCGPGRSCDYDGMQQCVYTPDFQLGCGLDWYDAERNARRVEELFYSVPEHLYVNLEVCDTVGVACELRSLPVTVY